MAWRWIKAIINPVILKWWREELDLDISFVAWKMKQSIEVIDGWESGESYPTMSQLKKIAEIYRTHITVFYLPEPPENIKPNINYRGIEELLTEDEKYKLKIHILEATERKRIATELYNNLELPRKIFPTISMDMGVSKVVGILREFLEESPSWVKKFIWKSSSDVLRYWKDKIERCDILVSQTNIINTHIGIGTNVMRWFCITGEGLPIIVLNAKDSDNWKIFTLFHELTHILLWWESEIQVTDFRDQNSSIDSKEEVFCNKVASELLVPTDVLTSYLDTYEGVKDWELIWRIARGFWVSEEVIMRKLYDSNRITKDRYEEFREITRIKWEELSAKKTKSESGWPTIEVRVISTNGKLFTHLTLLAYEKDKINSLNVSQFLNTKLDYLPKIERQLYGYAN
jgi:Zn-dependent peptidase ImmA (M78 family)/transcriptional regulator with XRE-family HTH domain